MTHKAANRISFVKLGGMLNAFNALTECNLPFGANVRYIQSAGSSCGDQTVFMLLKNHHDRWDAIKGRTVFDRGTLVQIWDAAIEKEFDHKLLLHVNLIKDYKKNGWRIPSWAEVVPARESVVDKFNRGAFLYR
jgi:hypothetical protein